MRKGYGLAVYQTEASWVGDWLCFFRLGTLLCIFFLNGWVLDKKECQILDLLPGLIR
jgi:hypothetical protein